MAISTHGLQVIRVYLYTQLKWQWFNLLTNVTNLRHSWQKFNMRANWRNSHTNKIDANLYRWPADAWEKITFFFFNSSTKFQLMRSSSLWLIEFSIIRFSSAIRVEKLNWLLTNMEIPSFIKMWLRVFERQHLAHEPWVMHVMVIWRKRLLKAPKPNKSVETWKISDVIHEASSKQRQVIFFFEHFSMAANSFTKRTYLRFVANEGTATTTKRSKNETRWIEIDLCIFPESDAINCLNLNARNDERDWPCTVPKQNRRLCVVKQKKFIASSIAKHTAQHDNDVYNATRSHLTGRSRSAQNRIEMCQFQ